MKKSFRKISQNLVNAVLAGALLFASFGCSDFVKGFKEGYKKGYDSGSGKPSNSSATETRGRNDLSNIVGGWTGRSSDNAKKVEIFFSVLTGKGGNEYGTATTTIDGTEAGTETYRIADGKNIEFETKQGAKYRVQTEISADGEKMTMTNSSGVTTTFQRE